MRRAVFSDLQRKGLERRFQIQKYISKPDRKKLAEKLGLKDSQVSSFLIVEGVVLRARREIARNKTKFEFSLFFGIYRDVPLVIGLSKTYVADLTQWLFRGERIHYYKICHRSEG